jgi:GMP synthase (glutamine-hydrolysing)
MRSETAVLVLEHIECEPPAAYGDELLERGVALHRVRLDRAEALPDWRRYAAIVVMGGPMSAYDDEEHPWLAEEKRLIAQAVGAGKPYWGVCLGAQLLAASLGARVYGGEQPEVGVLPVRLTAAGARDPVLGACPPEFDALHWHGDTYELPTGAVGLAGSARYEQQAFAFGSAYALQFHLEADATLVSRWAAVPAYARDLERADGEGARARLLADLQDAQSRSIPLARRVFARWLELVVGIPAARVGSAGT